jgi:hypothetical protein
MTYSIRIEGMYAEKAPGCVLAIDGPASGFPVTVGLSYRTHDGEIVDLPPQQMPHPGHAIFTVQQYRSDETIRDIIYALWRDTSFTTRLADTGWQHFSVTTSDPLHWYPEAVFLA